MPLFECKSNCQSLYFQIILQFGTLNFMNHGYTTFKTFKVHFHAKQGDMMAFFSLTAVITWLVADSGQHFGRCVGVHHRVDNRCSLPEKPSINHDISPTAKLNYPLKNPPITLFQQVVVYAPVGVLIDHHRVYIAAWGMEMQLGSPFAQDSTAAASPGSFQRTLKSLKLYYQVLCDVLIE